MNRPLNVESVFSDIMIERDLKIPWIEVKRSKWLNRAMKLGTTF